MKLIKSITTKTITIALAVYLLVVNCGISFSHIWCSQGSRWILGTEMPACKLADSKTICPYTKKECSHKNNGSKTSDSKEQRSKKSYTLNYKFVAEVINIVAIKATSLFKSTFFNITCIAATFSDYRQQLFSINLSDSRAHPPPLLSKPLLSEIQVYRI